MEFLYVYFEETYTIKQLLDVLATKEFVSGKYDAVISPLRSTIQVLM